MPETDDDLRIRKGLHFLAHANRRVIKAGVQLEKLLGTDIPPDVGDVLHWFHFKVEENQYRGRMTPEQQEYLARRRNSLREFADAIASVLLELNDAVVQMLRSLSRGLGASRASAPAATGAGESIMGFTPSLGCCRYDTNLERPQVTQSFCEGGLQGDWTVGPCVGKPPLPEQEE